MYYSKKIFLEKEEDLDSIHNNLIKWGHKCILNEGEERAYRFPMNEIEIDKSIWKDYNILKDFRIKTRVICEDSGVVIMISVMLRIISTSFIVFVIGCLMITYLIEMIVMNAHYHIFIRILFVHLVLSGLICSSMKIRNILKKRVGRLIDNLKLQYHIDSRIWKHKIDN